MYRWSIAKQITFLAGTLIASLLVIAAISMGTTLRLSNVLGEYT